MTFDDLAKLLSLNHAPFIMWRELTGQQQDSYKKQARRLLAYGATVDSGLADLHHVARQDAIETMRKLAL